MFKNMSLLIVQSLSLDESEVSRLEGIFQKNGAETVEITNDKEPKTTMKPYTHVISNSIDFADYNNFEQLMIPIVTSQWVYDSIDSKKLIPLRPYNPDPKFFFKDLVITVSLSLPNGDREAIYGGVRALGGQFSDQLLLSTTHLISMNLDDDLCCVARECNATGESHIKIVSPMWVDDCFKLRKKLDENPYLLEEASGALEENDLQKLDVRKSHDDIGVSRVMEQFLQKTKIFIGSDLELSERVIKTVEDMIIAAGGEVVKTLKDATIYIGKYRLGDEYVTLSRNGKIVGNLQWIYYMMAHNEWIIPTRKLLHYPVVKGGLPGFDKFVIGVTNYTGDGRFYLENLINAMGGVFTKNLKTTNTHLICAKPVGKKYEAAKVWQGVKIINHLWLEESYKKWKILDEQFPRFQHFPKDLNFSQVLGQTSLDEEILKNFYLELEKMDSVKDSLSGQEEIPNELELIPSKEKKTKKKEQLPSKRKLEEEHHKRSAKMKLAIKLHSDMEDLNFFQKQHADIPKLPQELVKKKKIELDYGMDVIVTGCENELELSLGNIEILSQFGIEVIQDFEHRQNRDLVLIAPRILRTEKFLSSLSLNLQNILVPAFLNDVIRGQNSDKIDVSKYELKNFLQYSSDLKLQEIWSEPSSAKIDRLLNNDKLVFEGDEIIIFSNVSQDLEKNKLYQRILQRHGCQRCEIITKKEELDSNCKILTKKKLGKKFECIDYDWVVKKIMLEI